MNTRLKQFLAAENITQAQFADKINVVRASVSHVLAGRNNPSFDFIKEMMAQYPNLNIEWLMFGKGKMYKENHPSSAAAQEILFPEEISDTLFSVQDSQPDMKMDAPVESSTALNTLVESTQINVTQRKVSKIIVLFDDGTFQEL